MAMDLLVSIEISQIVNCYVLLILASYVATYVSWPVHVMLLCTRNNRNKYGIV